MAYLDGEVPREAAAGIQAHLASCAICQRIVQDLKNTSAELERWRVDDPPPSLQLPPSPPMTARGSWLGFLGFRPAMAWTLAGGVVAVGFVALTTITAPARRTPTFTEAASRPVQPSVRTGVEGRGGGGRQTAPLPAADAAAMPAQREGGPLIARSATIRIVASRFDDVRPAIDRLLRDVKGFAGRLDATAERGASRTLNATLRVPAAALDAALGSLRQLGQVVAESQGGDDVTDQVVDVAARLANARHTESRLTDVLRQRTGKVSDVLEAEREIARVREQIERLDAERTNLDRRVAYATITLEVNEERKAAMDMGPLTVTARFRNAFVDGVRSAVASLIDVSLVLLRVAPALAVWVGLLFFPVRLIVRRTWARG
jgi:hypothetical protein